MRITAVTNQKGGAGKTTVAVNLSVALGQQGRRVLLVDTDPQADATTMLGIDPATTPMTLYDVLTGGCEVGEATIAEVAPRVDLVAGSERMADVELTLAGQMMRERFLADALAAVDGTYETILIDCPPNLGLLTVNALVASSDALVVVSMIDRNAYKGAMALISTLAELRRHGIEIALAGVLRNNADPHRQTYRAINEALTADLRLPVLDTQIPLRAEFQNAVTEGRPLLIRNPDHIGAEMLRRAAVELYGAPVQDRLTA